MDKADLRESILTKLNLCIQRAILCMVFFLPLSPTLTTASLCVGSAAWIIKLIATRGGAFSRTPFDLPILCFAVLSVVSILASPDAGFSFYNYYNLMGRYMFVYFLVVQNISTIKELKTLACAAAVAAVGVTFYGFYQYIFGIDISNMLWVDGEQFPELKTRVFSTLENPNILAGYLIAMMSIVFGLICKLNSIRQKSALTLLFVLMGTCLTMTYCRGAWLSVLLVITGYGVMKNRRILFALAILAVLVCFLDTSMTERLLSSFAANDTSSSMRIALWESTVAMIIEHPFFGIGWGAYWMIYPYYDFFIQNDAVKIVHAHNMYLNFAAEIGLPGLFCFLICLTGHMQLALSSVNLRQSDFLNGLTLGCGLAILSAAVNGLTDYVLFNIELSMFFWLTCAIIVVVCRRRLD